MPTVRHVNAKCLGSKASSKLNRFVFRCADEKTRKETVQSAMRIHQLNSSVAVDVEPGTCECVVAVTLFAKVYCVRRRARQNGPSRPRRTALAAAEGLLVAARWSATHAIRRQVYRSPGDEASNVALPQVHATNDTRDRVTFWPLHACPELGRCGCRRRTACTESS